MLQGQEEILLSLIQGVKGKAWAIDREGWDINYDNGVCFWEGIQCDTDQETVIGINLPSSELSLTLPTTLGLLTTLRQISLPQNIIHGTIPAEIAALPHLEALELSENRLTGTLPHFSSPVLRTFEVAYNELTGTLPEDVGVRHERMVNFNVLGNKLTGPIPESFARVIGLDTLTLSENMFSGTIPSALGEAKSLRYLYLDNNMLMGTIPAAIARVDSALAELWLHENLLSGTIPTTLSDLEYLFNFYIDGNKFTGTVPAELCREDLNADFYEDADATPEERDYCDSVACPVGQVSFEGVYPCEPCQDEYYNPYLGRVGRCIDLKQRDILQILYDKTGGDDWAGMTVPWETDSDYYCSFTGVTCDQNHNVIGLDLSNKGLRGQIPEEIGFLRYLEKLDLSDNHLTGYLPSDLRWAPLEELNISGNRLTGIVAPMLCLKPGLNGNGDGGKFGCEQIACPTGTYSKTGTGNVNGGTEQCLPCPEGIFLATKHCPMFKGAHSNAGEERDISGVGIFLIVAGVLGVMLGAFVSARRYVQRKKHLMLPQDEYTTPSMSVEFD